MKHFFHSRLCTLIAVCIINLCANQNAFAQFNYGTGIVTSNAAPFNTTNGIVTVSGNNVTVTTGAVNMVAGTYNFDSLTINSGATVTVTSGNSPLIIRCTGVFTNNGIITAAGGVGALGTTYNSGLGYGPGGAGGSSGGGWGGAGGAGGEGNSPDSYASGPGGNGGNFNSFTGAGIGGQPYTAAATESAGTGGSYATLGTVGTDCGSGCGAPNNSIGNTYGDAGLVTTATVDAITTNLLGGSGGGGGGGHNAGSTASPVLYGGDGGGGGGGAIRVTANSIVLNTGSDITVRGGAGPTDGRVIGSGGGGSGGTINLQYSVSSPTVPATANTDSSVASTTVLVDIAGGLGGNWGKADYAVGGNGGRGRYLAQQDVSACTAPMLNAEANGTASTISICTGNNVTLTANETGGSGCTNYIEYAWSNGTDYWGGTSFNQVSATFAQADSTITFTPSSSGTITYTVTARCNALTTCNSTSAVTVTVAAQPTAPTIATPNPDTSSACAGTNVTLSGPASGGNAGLSCGIEYWYSTDGGTTWSTPSTTIPSFAAVAGVGMNIIQARRNNCQSGCTGPTAWNTVATWNGTTLPFAPSILVSTPHTTICSGNSITFTASSSNGGTAPVYQWYKNGIAVGGDSTVYIDNNPVSHDSVYAVITSNASCATPNTATSNVVKDTVLVTPKDTITQTVCQGQSYDGHNANGTFVDTFAATNGCDSIRILNLTVKPVATSTIDQKVCQGQSFDGYNATGTYVDTLKNAAYDGCDSIRTINLNVVSPSVGIVSETICQGQSYNGHTTSGSYVDTLAGAAASGCDSINILTLTVTPTSISNNSKSICEGQTYEGHTTNGVYRDTLINGAYSGCDSISILTLSVLPVSRTSYTQAICPGGSFDGYSATGTYIDTFVAYNGCDSIRTLNLNVLTVVHDTVTTTLCQGQSYDGYTASGTYSDTFAVGACDSIRLLNLTILNNVLTSFNQSVCQGEAVYGHNATGTYVDTFTAANSCDSIRTLNLTVNSTLDTIVKARICKGDTFQNHTTAGAYMDTVVSSTGCDSIITLELEVDSVPATPLISQSGNTLSTEGGYGQYNWYNASNTLVYSGSDSFYVINQSGNYTVEVINGGCSITSTAYSATYTGIADVALRAMHLTVYPNPASDLLNIKLSGLTGTDEVNIKLYDVVGRLLADKSLTAGATDYTLQISVEDFADGLYLLQVRQGDANLEQRVIIGK